jgi:hypothetical protein
MRASPIICLLLLAGCVAAPPVREIPARDISAFSANSPDDELPHGWRPWVINRVKAETVYDLVRDTQTGGVVLHAVSDRSASGLRQLLDVDPEQRPFIFWRWRIVDLVVSADNQDRYSEDAPARLMLFFDGDRNSLPLNEKMLTETARVLTGHELPYATLMYIWENRFPPGTVLTSSYTGQVKMVVVGTGQHRVGTWYSFERNYVNDYRRAFGSAPGRLVGVGIMTDTDNTGESVETFYGDIELRSR